MTNPRCEILGLTQGQPRRTTYFVNDTHSPGLPFAVIARTPQGTS